MHVDDMIMVASTTTSSNRPTCSIATCRRSTATACRSVLGDDGFEQWVFEGQQIGSWA